MIASRRSLSVLLLATSAIICPAALAQEASVPEAQESTVAPDDGRGDVIVVRGDFIPEPLQETSEVAAFLTAVDLERQGDSDAADALARVTGLSVAEGRFVYVRGLGERYSSALLNGSPLPSPEPLQRVVPLDLFPASILAGVQVQKSYSVEFPGEFGGGVIALTTLNLPDETFLEIGVSAGLNTATTLATGYTYDGGGTADISGFDNGTRKLPFQLREALATGLPVASPNFTDAELQRIGQSFQNAKVNLVQVNDSIPGNGGIDISGGYRRDFDTFSIGLIGVLGYANDWETQDGIKQEGRIDGGAATVFSDYQFTSTTNKVGWDGLLGVGLEIGSDHTIDWTNLWVRRTDKDTFVRVGFDELAGEDVRDERTAWYERELLDTQLDGTHELGQFTVNWRAAYARTDREAPYERQMRFIFDDTIDRYLHDTSRATNRIEFSELTDEISSAGVNATWSIPMSTVRNIDVSAGVEHFDNARTSQSRAFRFVASNLPIGVQQSRPDFLFADFNISPDRLVLRETTGAGGAAAYDAQLEVTSAYAKIDFEPIPFFRVALGGRVERGLQSITPRTLFINEAEPAKPPKKKEEYFLPAGTVTWNFFDDMQLRVGASQTIGRPQFRELAPQQYLDPDSDRLFIGNPFLQDTELTNFDARYEYFFAPGQFFTIGAFFKDIEKPIESIVVEQGATIQQSYLNAPSAELYGAEAEVRRTFIDPLSNWWWIGGKDIFFQANYTYSDSTVNAKAGDLVFPLSGAGTPQPATNFIIDGTRLQGQSEHVANVQLGWEDPEADSQGTLIATYVSERSSARGRPGEPDYIQEPGVILDFVYRREFETWGRPVKFSVKAQNLLDEDYFEYQRFGGGEVIINQYDLGRALTLGLSTSF